MELINTAAQGLLIKIADEVIAGLKIIVDLA